MGRERERSWTKRPTIKAALLIGAVLLGVGGVVALSAGERALAERAAELRTAPGVEIQFVWPAVRGVPSRADQRMPTWLPEAVRAGLERLTAEHLNANPLDRDALASASNALAATGWFIGTPRLERLHSGRVRVEARWREPVAVVRSGERDHLVGSDAHLLPLSYPHRQSGLRAIIDPFSPPPERPGQLWIGGDVEAGLRLLALLQSTAAFDQVAGVDVSGWVRDRELVIVTDRGRRVVWGSAPGDWAPGEPTTEWKLARLQELRDDPAFGRRIDAGRSAIWLTNPRGVMFEPPALQSAGDEAPVSPARRGGSAAPSSRQGPVRSAVSAHRDR
jgi:hypothetical protein